MLASIIHLGAGIMIYQTPLGKTKNFLCHPIKTIKQLIGIGPHLKQKPDQCKPYQVIIITGAVNSGKTTLLQQFLSHIEKSPYKVNGVVAEGVWHKGDKNGYDAFFLFSGKRQQLCRKGLSSPLNIGPFGFNEEVFISGEKSLSAEQNSALTILDEIGRLELAGKGWAATLSNLLLRGNRLLIVVRYDFIGKVIQKFSLTNYAIINTETEGALEELIRCVNR